MLRNSLMLVIGALVNHSAIDAMAQFDLSWYTVDGGGAMYTSGGSYELSGTIGQCDAGAPMSAGHYTLVGGFWPVALPGAPQPGDCDADGDVDLLDFAELQESFDP